MASGPMSVGSSVNEPPSQPGIDATEEPKHGGFTRFELELEFVQALANPQYLNHLASRKFLSDPRFVAYLAYLQYWTRPPYLKYLTYPGPTIKHLELLQQEKFRQDIISPDLVHALMMEGMRASVERHQPASVDSVDFTDESSVESSVESEDPPECANLPSPPESTK